MASAKLRRGEIWLISLAAARKGEPGKNRPATPRPTAAQVAARLHAVVLGSPAQTPPPGTLGLYSDGAAHVYSAQSDHAGKLLFFERDGETVRTNLLRYLESFSLLWGAGR